MVQLYLCVYEDNFSSAVAITAWKLSRDYSFGDDELWWSGGL